MPPAIEGICLQQLQPTPIQRYAIPLIMSRKNVCCLAPNGSGKTVSSATLIG